MVLTLVVMAAVAAGWSLVAGRLERWHIRTPQVMVLAGVVVALVTEAFIDTVNSTVAQHVAEVILAVLLFVDATEVRGGRLFGEEPGLAARALLIAMPLSLALAVVIGWPLLPSALGWPALLVIACIVVPIDLAPAESLVRDRSVPERVRGLLNVESGYNDGIMSPLFLFALVLAGTSSSADTPLEALGTAVPSAVKAVLAGLCFGLLIAWLMNTTERLGWTTDQSRRITMVAAPLLTYTVTVAVGGNGFVAAFVCGIAFRFLRQVAPSQRVKRRVRTPDMQLLEDTAAMATIAMWFYLGNAAVLTLWHGISWQLLLYCLAVLTVVRIVPMLLALTGSSMPWRERLIVGAIGPRGTTSIVFGLLAFNDLPEGDLADTALAAMTITVIASVLLHGPGSLLVGRVPWSKRRATA
ncbi:putative sodium/proton antiporter [Actinoplanes missouriensis 431]|uniref:Putative sodium/proton antiporter n=1 Tax=Actinoplanes missouriensis (strain ATCC 14538 / DSM 43046 / CBS 188.64 / JCM 3121 / NBRC 102363 / NCIMB 12654 / NRRL B-3342 / UNCC 431) TaxID=512565 RepID=I0H4H4_ACTM4|nr:cation:proton antiporter [Actinoplanes missouriensis]BAL87911.1 putative sodium/proton antiporter [Actinoplanes missouriensis 431]